MHILCHYRCTIWRRCQVLIINRVNICCLIKVNWTGHTWRFISSPVQNSTLFHTSPWWRWFQRTRRWKRRVWPLSLRPGEGWTPSQPLHLIIYLFLAWSEFKSCRVHVLLNSFTLLHLWASLLPPRRVKNWIKQIIPQPMMPPGTIPSEPPSKASRSSIDKSKKNSAVMLVWIFFCMFFFFLLGHTLHHINHSYTKTFSSFRRIKLWL